MATTETTIKDLRAVVRNESLAQHDRQHAASLLVSLKADVTSRDIPPVDDPEGRAQFVEVKLHHATGGASARR